MIYTEHGLKITLEELENILNRAKNEAQFGNMEECIYIKGGDKPTIKQYCVYVECNPINYTYSAR